MSRYRSYIWGPVWRERSRRHLRRHPYCMGHGAPCRARVTHHASYWCWRRFGREAPWEKVSLCNRAHDTISAFHHGVWIPNVLLFALTWTVIGWLRLTRLWTPRRAPV